MRRYTALLLVAFVFLVLLLAGNTYLAGYADRKIEKNMKELTVYTTLPVEHAAILADEYERANKVRVNFVPLEDGELIERVKRESTHAKGKADAILASQAVLQRLAKEDALGAFASETADIVADRFKDERGLWAGVWYDPIVLCANRDYLETVTEIPMSWEGLAKQQNIRIGLTDFLAADAAANLLYTMVAEYDEARTFAFLSRIHPKVVQYSKFLATPVRMAGMGEVDVSIAVLSECLRYQKEGFPITLIYPVEGTSYLLTGAAVTKNSGDATDARQFVQWLLEDNAQLCQQKNQFYFVPTNQETLAYQSFSGKNLTLFENYSDLSAAQKSALLDRWVKNVRLK